MFINITQLIILIGMFSWIISKLTKNKIIFYIGIMVFASLLTIEASSVYLINQPFGYQYWININVDDIRMYIFQFHAEMAFAGVFLILVFALLNYLAKKIGSYKNTNWIKYQWITPIACLLLLSFPNGVLHTLYDFLRIKFVQVESVEEALAGIGINSSNYIFPEQLTATAGKNIVVISVESLEKGFLTKSYADENLTPNLNRLASENYFQVMRQAGGGWTVGSLYITLTGIPPFFKNADNGNYIFQNLESINYSTLGSVLKKAGYASRYLISDSDFAGTDYLLKANHFQVVSNKNGENLGAFKTSNDLDLFSEAKKQLDVLSNKKEPFALFLSTINTHFPAGIYDPRMESLIKRKKSDFKNDIDYSVMATDYLIGDFIDYIKSKNLLENTIFYIYPDHTMMGNGAPVRRLASLGRGLYLITNAKERDLKAIDKTRLSQLNIPRAIVDGSGIETNVKFPSDFSGVNFKSAPAIASLNASIFAIQNFKNSLRIQVEDSFVILGDGGIQSAKEAINPDTKWVNFIFNKDMRLLKSAQGSEEFIPFDGGDLIFQPLQLTIFLNRQIPTGLYFGNYKNIGSLQPNEKKEKVLYLTSGYVEKIKSENKLAFSNMKYDPRLYVSTLKLKSVEEYLEVTSSEYTSYQSAPSKIKLGDLMYPVARGINLLYWEKDQFLFKNYDTYGSEDQAFELLKKLNDLHARHERYLLVASDAVQNIWKGYSEGLNQLGLNVLGSLQGRTAYIGYYNGSRSDEYSDPKTINKLISFYVNVKEWTPPPAPALSEYLKDKKRFIAHGGGMVEGKTYTDSLDALNNSYSKGIRLLELDISKTSDGHYVAAHDFEHWANISGYKGSLPPSHEVFMSQKIYGSMSPLDMKAINEWFKNHPDAILVTDKVNEPREFSNQFIDKNRLMMELFDSRAVLEAIEVGILAPMPTDGIWPEIYKNHRDLIRNGKIKYVAASRNINKISLRQILDSNIKIFAFHINFGPTATEKWVACNERNIFYGMYIDDVAFFEKTKCN